MRILFAAGGNVRTREENIAAENTFTEWVRIDGRGRSAVYTASLIDNSTTLSCTWTIQMRRIKEDGTQGNTFDAFTSSAASNGGVQTASIAGLWEARVGVKTGNLGAGTGMAAISWA